jgi:UDP-glucose 4-epimerase
MKIIVTGGAGFIGSHIVDRLYEDGHDVVCVDNESAESNEKFYWKKRGVKNLFNSIEHQDGIKHLFLREKPDAVIHLAAEARIQKSIDDPVKVCIVNYVGTANLLQACKDNGVKRFVFSSTSSVYGLKNDPPLIEDMPTDCLNPYSISKLASENLCKFFNDSCGLETIVFRYFNVYGDRQPLKGLYAPVVGLFLEQHKGGTPMTVVGDGEQTRDFTHVEDVVNANILALMTENKKAFGEVFNIGSGVSYSVNSLAEMIGGEKEHIETRVGEARHTLADVTKAKKILGWKATKKLKDYLRNELTF